MHQSFGTTALPPMELSGVFVSVTLRGEIQGFNKCQFSMKQQGHMYQVLESKYRVPHFCFCTVVCCYCSVIYSVFFCSGYQFIGNKI
jgi:hypothetical protein